MKWLPPDLPETEVGFYPVPLRYHSAEKPEADYSMVKMFGWVKLIERVPQLFQDDWNNLF